MLYRSQKKIFSASFCMFSLFVVFTQCMVASVQVRLFCVRANLKYPFFTHTWFIHSVCYRLFIYLFIRSFIHLFKHFCIYSLSHTIWMSLRIFFLLLCTICVSFVVDSLLFKLFRSLPFALSLVWGYARTPLRLHTTHFRTIEKQIFSSVIFFSLFQ